MLTDLPEAGLWEYRSSAPEPPDFDEFWEGTLEDARQHPVSARLEPVQTGLTTLEHFDLTFAGFNGEDVRGWLVRPAGVKGPLPTVVQYVGYGGGRGTALENLLWASAGFAHLVMDNRGAASSHRPGVTPDPHGSGPSYPGFMTRGIASPRDHYFRRLFTDAVRAVDAAAELPMVDPDRIGVVGGSQGGALALAASVLNPRVRAVACFVPFLSDIRRATLITDEHPYREISAFLETHRNDVEATFRTLSYFDGVHLARRASCPTLFSVALLDTTCPPSTVYAAYAEWSGVKDMVVYDYNNHEGGGAYQQARQLAWVAERLAR